jgi:uncharacterized protein (DUF1778 family)
MATLSRSRPARKGDRLVARISREDKSLIRRAASLTGQSVGRFVLDHARKAALDALETNERMVLSAGQSRRFVEALLAPPRPPTPAMVKAVRAYRARVKSDLDN